MNASRRKLLKSMGYGIAAVSAGATSSAVMALTPSASKAVASALPTCDITIYQQENVGKELVSLMNLTDQTITLDSIKPVGLEHINGSLVVRLNNLGNGKVQLKPNERLSFEVEAVSQAQGDNPWNIPNVLSGHVSIKSDHPAFNGVIPVTVFDAQVA